MPSIWNRSESHIPNITTGEEPNELESRVNSISIDSQLCSRLPLAAPSDAAASTETLVGSKIKGIDSAHEEIIQTHPFEQCFQH